MNLPIIDPNGVWRLSFFFGLSAGLIVGAIKLKGHSLFIRCLAVYVIIQALYLLEYPAGFFYPFTANFQATAGQVLAEIILIPFTVWALYKNIPKLLIVVTVYELYCIWCHRPGLFTANSFDMAFCVLGISVAPIILAFSVLVTVIVHHGTTAALMLGSILILRALRRGYYGLGSVSLLLLGMSAFRHSGPLFDGQDRLNHYKTFFNSWPSLTRAIFGVGPGTFIWSSLMIYQYKGEIFFQMHCDWLQILWELGAIGLILCFCVWTKAVRLTWTKDFNCSLGLIAGGIFMISYHPLRYFPSAFLICYFFMRAFYVSRFEL